ncbi:MAG: UbiX family flavin prenyltransferase [Candidatus Sumerlaeia bacterium]|nr:UbiX family flavin prenyltransferase [Candidatus Sumerlaeia bacterium]
MSEGDVIVGITGASGSIYAQAFVKELLFEDLTVHLIPTAHADVVWRNEMETAGERPRGEADATTRWRSRMIIPAGRLEHLRVYADTDVAAAPASGTFRARAMVVVPCSMNTLAKVAHGVADTLLTRAAAACLKERRPLILVVRETPLSLADLRNQVAAAEAGATILPAAPAFYHRPTDIAGLVHFIVSKICDQIGLLCPDRIGYRSDAAE